MLRGDVLRELNMISNLLWSRFVDLMEVRLVEIPLLYVNIASWKLRNVFLTINSLHEYGGTYFEYISLPKMNGVQQ